MRIAWVGALLGLWLLGACNGNGGGGAPGVAIGFTAILRVPAPGARHDPASHVVLEFTRLVDHATLGSGPGVALQARRGGDAWQELPVARRALDDDVAGRTLLLLAGDRILPAEAGLRVVLSDRVQDLDGHPLEPLALAFDTLESPGELFLEEDFLDTSGCDLEATGADWAGYAGGGLRPGRQGGPGILGEFVAGPGETVIATEDSLWPAASCLTGQEQRVSNGIFFFQRFEVPKGAEVRFSGSHPVQLHVAGDCIVAGSLVADGHDAGPWDGGPGSPRGGLGGPGGPGGGTGGQGGGQPAFSRVTGFPGEGVRLLPGHPRQSVGTGGPGAPGHPETGLNEHVVYDPDDFTRMIASGGGGGGFLGTSQAGLVVQVPPPFALHAGAPSEAAAAFPLLPLVGSLDPRRQFLLGGSGGGGGGAHPFRNEKDFFGLVNWRSSGGGGGGGGALQIRAGRNLRIEAGGLVAARGGAGSRGNTTFATPGGGGSGGGILLQAAGLLLLAGKVSVGGGSGGLLEDPAEGILVRGGDGAPGFCRVESDPKPELAALAGLEPAPLPEAAGLLEGGDPVTSALSLPRATGAWAPRYLRYELEVLEGTRIRIYSDDPAVGDPGLPGLTPASLAFQGIAFDGQGQIAGRGLWAADLPAISQAGSMAPPGLRWAIRLDANQLPPNLPFRVLALRVFYRP